ncbi:dioxygenase, partial [Pseudomonas syringae pv. tagetis]
MYPDADIPVVQVSLPSRQGPELQTHVGRAQASLREQGVLIVGSGRITHNLYDLEWNAGPERVEPWAVRLLEGMNEKIRNNDEPPMHRYRTHPPLG